MNDEQKAKSKFQICKLALPCSSWFSPAAKLELIELVKAYKGRKYDEELLGVENLGGKSLLSCVAVLTVVFLVRRCRRHQ